MLEKLIFVFHTTHKKRRTNKLTSLASSSFYLTADDFIFCCYFATRVDDQPRGLRNTIRDATGSDIRYLSNKIMNLWKKKSWFEKKALNEGECDFTADTGWLDGGRKGRL